MILTMPIAIVIRNFHEQYEVRSLFSPFFSLMSCSTNEQPRPGVVPCSDLTDFAVVRLVSTVSTVSD